MNPALRSFLLALSVLPAAALATAEAPSTIRFDIEEQDLAAALSAFAQQSDRQILFSTDIVHGKRNHGIKGDLEPTAVLRILLQGTGLVFSVLPNETILVQSAADPSQAQSNAHPQGYLRLTQAETVPSVSATDTSSSSSSPGADAENGEVVVKGFRATTATKTDVLLTETPQAVSIVTADDIANRGALGLQEALRYTAGVRTEINGSDLRFDYYSARGFSATEYQDGMVRADGYNTARSEVYTLERVEVLRGPSSVLYGQGTAGGVVNSLTKRPRDQFASEFALEYGSFDRKQAQFDVTGPLTDGLSGRLVGVYRDADNQFDFGRDDRIVVAPSLAFRPTDATEVVLLGLYQKDEAGSVFPYLPVQATLNAPGRRLPDDRFLGEPDFNHFDREEKNGSLLVTHHFTDSLTYDGGVRYSDAKGYNAGIYGSIWNGVNPFIDPAQTLLPRYRYDYAVKTQVVTTDNRLAFKASTGILEHNLLGGVDYAHTDYRTASAYAEGATPLNVYDPVYGQPGSIIDAELSDYSGQKTRQLGFYLQDHIRIGGRTTLVAGARHDKVTTGIGGGENQIDKATTFRVGATYDIVDNVTPYVSYSESFIPTIGVDFYGNEFKPQEGKQYEVGVKWQMDPSTLLSVAGFHLVGTNRPQTDPENGMNTIQSGEVRSRGFEFEAIRRLPRDYSFSLSYTYIDMEVTKATNPLEEGLPISAVPKHQAPAWGEKQFTLNAEMGARLGVGVRAIGKSREAAVFSSGDVLALTSPGFTLVDALVAFNWRNSEIALNATNLLDEHYYGSCSIETACSVGYRRNVIARYTYRF